MQVLRGEHGIGSGCILLRKHAAPRLQGFESEKLPGGVYVST